MATKIFIRSEWCEVSSEFANTDVSLEQYFTAFKGMLVSLSWSEHTINEYIIEISEDLKGIV